MNSHRQVVGLSATRKFDDLKLTFGGAYSQENFYRATTGLASVSRDLANGNTTVAGGFSFSLNQPMLHPLPETREPVPERRIRLGDADADEDARSRRPATRSRTSAGYQNNPYLRADVNGVMVLGQVPDLRTRQTLSARLRQALPADTYLEADYRRYFDDWQVTSNTVSVGLSHYFRPDVLLALTYRRYDQTGAFFWAPQYTGTPQYYTADFRLEPFASNTYTGRIEIAPKGIVVAAAGGQRRSPLQYERYSCRQRIRCVDRVDRASRAAEGRSSVR